MKTTVVNVKHGPCDVYIGRPHPRYPGGSIWGNPYKTPPFSRPESIRKYRRHIKRKLKENPELREELEKLRGKRLGCWCKPYPCHGDVLVELLEGS
ncbi:MAG: DUF4326 domain-containing protein [Candidatus Nitrospinota bacterium M3_3B_026]